MTQAAAPPLVTQAAAPPQSELLKRVAAAGRRASEQQLAAMAAASTAFSQHPLPFRSLPSAVYGGKYQMARFLGRGASATVWEAVHEDNRMRAAIKVFDQGSKDKRQAQRELKVLSRVQHPHVLEAYEVVEGGTTAQLVCELVDGESLRTFAQRQPSQRLEEKQAKRFYRQVVDGVNYCHERLVVHRDLKLDNLLLDRRKDTVKIIDFGFAAQVASKETKLRAFCGTPSYMAPEIIRGDGYSGFAADVWALGVVAFALLSGALPFVARTELQLYAKIRRGLFNCPEVLGDVAKRLVKGTLRMDPTARPSVGAVMKHTWLAGSSPKAGQSGSIMSALELGSSFSATGLAEATALVNTVPSKLASSAVEVGVLDHP